MALVNCKGFNGAVPLGYMLYIPAGSVAPIGVYAHYKGCVLELVSTLVTVPIVCLCGVEPSWSGVGFYACYSSYCVCWNPAGLEWVSTLVTVAIVCVGTQLVWTSLLTLVTVTMCVNPTGLDFLSTLVTVLIVG